MSRFTLIAVDPDGVRREFPLEQREYVVGREPESGAVVSGIAIPGDRHLSREHFKLDVQTEKVVVTKAERGRNPLFYKGEQSELFSLRPGQVFYTGKTQFGVVLGTEGGATTHFTLADKAKAQARFRRLEDCFNAVLELLSALRKETGTPAWQVAFPVLRRILPDVLSVGFVQLHGDSGLHRVIDKEPREANLEIDPDTLMECVRTESTVTTVADAAISVPDGNMTLVHSQPWLVVSPVSGLESQFAMVASGAGSLSKEALLERATLVDLVCEMVGHHIVIQQGSEYSNLLGVFGHHIGTLFKTSGALQLWSDVDTAPEVKEVLSRLLPVWGISQAISLHKKRGEKAHRELLAGWVKSGEASPESLVESLTSLVSHTYHANSERPFFEWRLNGREVPRSAVLQSLPPLNDVPGIFDKTLALTVGLLEVLTNVRKYPSSRGSGREDREDLADLTPEESFVAVEIECADGSVTLTVRQPVVTAPDGSIPRSRSLERIRALEQSLLGSLVGTQPEEIEGALSAPNVVLVRHRWSYQFGQLIDDWRKHVGS